MIGKSDDEPLNEADAEQVLAYCTAYFSKHPYISWFNKYERFLKAFGLSYYSGSVVHLDLVQWATTPSWGGLTSDVKDRLLARDLPFLKELLKKKFRFIFLNGKTTVSEVSKHLDLNLREVEASGDDKKTCTLYFGVYENSKVIGWSKYLQSAAIGSYANVDKLASEVFRQTGGQTGGVLKEIGGPKMTVHGSFVEWVEKDILPLKAKNPTWHRLDGKKDKGNRKVVGTFRHAGLKWVVKGDSQFEPILRAYRAITEGQESDPFIIEPTSAVKCLDFVPALRKAKQPKLFYAYS